ncbi:MAG: valine--tRNA ligase, partial [Hyphococcus sp.]
EARIKTYCPLIQRLARLSSIGNAEAAPKGAVQLIHEGATFALPLGDVIDIDAEKARLEKEVAKATKEIAGIDKKLANKNFVDRAPKEVVEEQHRRKADYEAQLEKLNAAMVRLKEL